MISADNIIFPSPMKAVNSNEKNLFPILHCLNSSSYFFP